MIEYNNIPIAELKHSENISIFNYCIGENTLINRESIWREYFESKFDEKIQILDNGTLIVSQNIFGGQSIISKYTCGLYFCYNFSRYLNGLSNFQEDFTFSISGADYHSGWDYDFSLRIVAIDNEVMLVKNFDFVTEVVFDKLSFLKNYYRFSTNLCELFISLYPKLKTESFYKDLVVYNKRGKSLESQV